MYLSIYVSICLSVCLSVYLSIYLSIYSLVTIIDTFTNTRRRSTKTHSLLSNGRLRGELLTWCKRTKFDGYDAQHTVRGRPTLKLVERFGNRSVRELYERSFTSELSIEKYQAKSAHVNTTVYLDGIENPVEYQKLLWNVSDGKETTGICLWAYSLKHTEVLLATSLCEG